MKTTAIDTWEDEGDSFTIYVIFDSVLVPGDEPHIEVRHHMADGFKPKKDATENVISALSARGALRLSEGLIKAVNHIHEQMRDPRCVHPVHSASGAVTPLTRIEHIAECGCTDKVSK